MNPCFMLRKCISRNDETDGIELKLRCLVNCSCCSGGSVVNDIDEIDGKDEKENKNEADGEGEEGKARLEIGENSKAVERNLLQSTPSGKSRFNKCFSCCCKASETNSEGMADEAANVYTSSKCIQTLSNSQILREHH